VAQNKPIHESCIVAALIPKGLWP